VTYSLGVVFRYAGSMQGFSNALGALLDTRTANVSSKALGPLAVALADRAARGD